MRISDWSSDVCSSDLVEVAAEQLTGGSLGIQALDAVVENGLGTNAGNDVADMDLPPVDRHVKAGQIARAVEEAEGTGDRSLRGQVGIAANTGRDLRITLVITTGGTA